MIRNIYILLLLSLSFGLSEPQTGWSYDSATPQAFYIFEEITIDGDVVVGDGSVWDECYTSYNCDVVGAFRRGICEDPMYQNSQNLCEIFSVWNTDEEICVGWRYADSNGGTTVNAMGKEGGEETNTFTYMNAGESAYIKIYDASNGSILDLNPSSELPGWELNTIAWIQGTSTADNVFGCNDPSACNYYLDTTADDGSCAYEYDCADTCGGDLELDCCGVCGGDNSQCSNCCGSPFYEDCTDDCSIDINEECCYELEVDACGVCNGDGTDCNNDGIPDDCEEVYTAGLEEGILLGAQSGDVNGDGVLNVIDIVIFVDMIMNP